MSELLNDPITARGTVYPDDCDHMGHMNVATYTRKYDEGTWAFWSSVGMSPKRMLAEGIGIAAMESNLTYKKELFPGDSFVIRSRFVWGKPRTAQFHHRLYVLGHDGEEVIETLAGTCTYTVACLDREAHKATAFPEDVAARVQDCATPMPEEPKR